METHFRKNKGMKKFTRNNGDSKFKCKITHVLEISWFLFNHT